MKIDDLSVLVPSAKGLRDGILSLIAASDGANPISTPDLYRQLIERLGLPLELLDGPPVSVRSPEPLFKNRVRYSLMLLTQDGLIRRPETGRYLLTIRGFERARLADLSATDPGVAVSEEIYSDRLEEGNGWRNQLLERIMAVTPTGFEHLCRKLLIESGFVDVEVTKQSNDGGIDGFGSMRFNRLVNFNIVFQCKRYKAAQSIPSKDVRDLRGAMQGRANNGLFITTSDFTNAARQEAKRVESQRIDLVDGYSLADTMRRLSLGVDVREVVSINDDWFGRFDNT